MNTDNSFPTSKNAAANLADDADNSVQLIRDNLTTLKTDVAELGRAVKSEGTRRLEEVSADLKDRYDGLKDTGSEEMIRVQDFVRANPGRSLAYAFGAGVVLTLLMGRR